MTGLFGNFLQLASGVVGVQAMNLLAAPFFARWYTPTELGAFGTVFALGTSLSLILTLRYENAILVSKSSSETHEIFLLVNHLSFLLGLLVLCAVFVVNLIVKIDILIISSIVLYAIFVSLNTSKVMYLNHLEKYKEIRTMTLVISITQIFLAFVLKDANQGLTFSLVVAQVTCVAFFLVVFRSKDLLGIINPKKMYELMNRYKQFPQFALPADALNAFSSQAPLIILNLFASSNFLGLYVFSQRLLGISTIITGKTIALVYRQEAAKEFMAEQTMIKSLKKYTILLFLASMIFHIVLFLFAKPVIDLFFGAEWSYAVPIILILIPLNFVKTIVSPLSHVFYIAEKNIIDLYWQILYVLSMLFLYFLGQNKIIDVEVNFIYAFSLGGIVLYSIYYVLIFIVSKKGTRL